jgi:hypothetical protein
MKNVLTQTQSIFSVFFCAATLALGTISPAHAEGKKPATKGFQFVPQNDEIKALAQRFISGTYGCEFGEVVTVKVRADHPGYIDLTHHKHTHHMLPVVTDTGALRAESALEGGVWLQLPTKNMLMNSKKGQRLADDCQLKKN